MNKKDYESAARIVQEFRIAEKAVIYVVDAFVALFSADSPHFDEARFRAACVPGTNVKARGRAAK